MVKKKTHKKIVKKPTKKKVVKRVVSRTPTTIDHEMRACIAGEIASAKTKKRLTRKEKRQMFDSAYAKCLRQNH
ncbi:MAG: hypothetical protein KKD44_27110 [Proteobacteria bacterium]|nr:hypothetical protein [Pseudomonadota bacterium]